ncbi:Lipopolysaccharide export LptBFGC system, permease protein LptF [Gulbenkiania indica]|uniref:Lipopolysaccharide export system permease protein LptF n=1 Tax=Gulbenkiania indica TaxID=375574 RepID=A0A0K6H024_9NEIS|nr:LPS export ABC transporter permease LptF [Gulbenkiania indica]CUA84338.1 Lipopolysaccharide export LptBFGC system, permease protein LptF [Gulbenkiania indica]
MVFHKSLTRELTFTAVGVFVVLLAILLSTQAINLLGRAAEGRVANEAVAALIGFWALGLFPLLLILTVFVSTLVVLTRVWRDHEMAVWLSAGVSLRNWTWPIQRFALPLALLVAVVSLYVGPWAQQRSKQYAEILKQREELSAIAPGIFKESKAANRIYFVENYSGERGAASNIFVQDITEGRVATVLARAGKVETKENGERVLVLENGRRYAGEPGSKDYEEADFERFTVSIGEQQPLIGPATNRQALPTALLWASNRAEDKAELAWRLSMPLSCLILAFLAVPLSYFNPRSGHTYNLVFALLAYFLYQNGLTLTRNWISQDRIPVLAILLPHALMAGLGLLLMAYRSRPSMRFGQFLMRGLRSKA